MRMMTAIIGDHMVNSMSGKMSPMPPRTRSTVAGTMRNEPGWLISNRSIRTPITMNANDRSVARDIMHPIGFSLFIFTIDIRTAGSSYEGTHDAERDRTRPAKGVLSPFLRSKYH